MPFWERLAILGGVLLGSLVLAKLVDARMRRRQLAAGAETRYRVLRRTVVTAHVVE
jgi:hypothetical protein